jgi:hypothetical protein
MFWLRRPFAACMSLGVHMSHQMVNLVRSHSWCDLTNGEGCGSSKCCCSRRGAFPPIVNCVQYAKNLVLGKISTTKDGLRRPPLRLCDQWRWRRTKSSVAGSTTSDVTEADMAKPGPSIKTQKKETKERASEYDISTDFPFAAV